MVRAEDDAEGRVGSKQSDGSARESQHKSERRERIMRKVV